MKKKILNILILLAIIFIPKVSAYESNFEFYNEFELSANSWTEGNLINSVKTEEGYVVLQGGTLKLLNESGRQKWKIEIAPEDNYSIDFVVDDNFVIYVVNFGPERGVYKVNLANGEEEKSTNDIYGFYIDKLGDNYVLASWDGIATIDSNLNVINTNIDISLHSNKGFIVEDNTLYVLTWDKANSRSGIATLDSELNVKSQKTITGSNLDFYVDSFFKVGNDFYVTHFDVYKISSSGKATMVWEDGDEDKYFISGAKVGDYIVLGGARYSSGSGCVIDELEINHSPGTPAGNKAPEKKDGEEPPAKPEGNIEGPKEKSEMVPSELCGERITISVFDLNFNYIEELPVYEPVEDIIGVVKNITPTSDGFLAKWTNRNDNDDPYVAVTEYRIRYNVETKTDGNGTVEASTIRAFVGSYVEFTVKPKPGYVLSEVKVTDANGNVVIFTDYKFTMPSADVLIEAKFIPENPNTADMIIASAIIIAVGLGLVFLVLEKKVKWLK